MGEETLGWSANVGQLALGETTADGDNTAPERHGRGFVRCGEDDREPSLGAPNPGLFGCHWRRAGRCDDDREETNEDGSDDHEDIGGVHS